MACGATAGLSACDAEVRRLDGDLDGGGARGADANLDVEPVHGSLPCLPNNPQASEVSNYPARGDWGVDEPVLTIRVVNTVDADTGNTGCVSTIGQLEAHLGPPNAEKDTTTVRGLFAKCGIRVELRGFHHMVVPRGCVSPIYVGGSTFYDDAQGCGLAISLRDAPVEVHRDGQGRRYVSAHTEGGTNIALRYGDGCAQSTVVVLHHLFSNDDATKGAASAGSTLTLVTTRAGNIGQTMAHELGHFLGLLHRSQLPDYSIEECQVDPAMKPLMCDFGGGAGFLDPECEEMRNNLLSTNWERANRLSRNELMTIGNSPSDRSLTRDGEPFLGTWSRRCRFLADASPECTGCEPECPACEDVCREATVREFFDDFSPVLDSIVCPEDASIVDLVPLASPNVDDACPSRGRCVGQTREECVDSAPPVPAGVACSLQFEAEP